MSTDNQNRFDLATLPTLPNSDDGLYTKEQMQDYAIDAICKWSHETPQASVHVLFVKGKPVAASDTPYSLSTYGDQTAIHQQIYTNTPWIPTGEGLLDDDITVLMALSNNEVWPGFRTDGQWFYVSGEPCCETPSHYSEMPRHPMDTAP